MKNLIIAIVLFFTNSAAFCQDFAFGQVTINENNFNINNIDSTANAVVLKEFGKSFMQLNDNTGRMDLIFEYHVRIKIINKNGFVQANILIPTYKDGNNADILSGITASTFNFKNGYFEETALDKKAIFTENRDKYTLLTKFTMPNLKAGSIIEYSYRLESTNLFNYKSWEFQSNIPKATSEYEVNIPAIYNYNVLLRGPYKLSEQKSVAIKECMRISGAVIDCSKISYIMNNIPAFIEEDYMTAASNFKSAVYFELSDIQRLDGTRQNFTKTWKDVDHELSTAKNLGNQMRRTAVFKDLLPAILKNTTDDLTKAKAIYHYIKNQIRWNKYYGKYSEENIKTVIDNRSGNVADINLSLIAALSAANLSTEAVILSTRDNGTVNKIYPVMSEFNYIVAKVNIGENSYLLDATEPLLPFGLLPLRCINGQGRVINLKKPSYWIDLKASQKSVTSYSLTGILDKDGKIKGTIITHSLGYDAFNKRKDIKMYNSAAEYVEKLDERLTKLSISKQEIQNIDSLEMPLTERYEVEFAAHDGTSTNELYINPFYINPVDKNPFNLTARTYPVDLGAASEERIIVNITLPDSYELLENPKDMAIGLPNNGGKYLLQTTVDGNKVIISQLMQFNKAIYGPEEYLYLKEFYSKIIQNQKTDLLLKKKG
ncbi:MAG: DUF3857 domain-containing protein [Bacteroidota bacterium]